MGVFMGREVFSVTKQMRYLRERAGFSMEEMAHALGYRHASSIQCYENDDRFSQDYLPVELTQKIAKALLGLGQPSIKSDDVWALCLPDVRKRLLAKQRDAYNESVTVRLPPEMVTGQLAANIIDCIEEVKKPNPAASSDDQNGGGELNDHLEDFTDELLNGMSENAVENQSDRLLPVFSPVESGVNGGSTLDGNAIFDVSCPPQLFQSTQAYAVEVSDETMWPRYRDGELVYCDPERMFKKGDFVVAQVMTDNAKAPQTFVKMFLESNSEELVLAQFNPPQKLIFENDKVVSIDYITLSGDAN